MTLIKTSHCVALYICARERSIMQGRPAADDGRVVGAEGLAVCVARAVVAGARGAPPTDSPVSTYLASERGNPA